MSFVSLAAAKTRSSSGYRVLANKAVYGIKPKGSNPTLDSTQCFEQAYSVVQSPAVLKVTKAIKISLQSE